MMMMTGVVFVVAYKCSGVTLSPPYLPLLLRRSTVSTFVASWVVTLSIKLKDPPKVLKSVPVKPPLVLEKLQLLLRIKSAIHLLSTELSVLSPISGSAPLAKLLQQATRVLRNTSLARA